MKKLFGYFLQGLLYIAPFAITIYIIYQSFKFIDGLLLQLLVDMFGIKIPGLGLLLIIIFLIATGFLGQSFIARPLKVLFQKLLGRVPLLKFIYSALNDLFSAFVGKEKKFNKPVLVLVNPVSNLEKLGFVTDEDLSQLGTLNKVAVYFPHSYNFSGELFIVPKDQIKKLAIDPGEMMKFIVSAGVTRLEDSFTKS